jgi:hypothetical protein
MSGFIYFLPTELTQLVIDGQLQHSALGPQLSTVLADVNDVPNDCIATPVKFGPDDQPGTVLFPMSPGVDIPKVPGFVPETQSWHQPPGASPRFWLGFDGDPPRPEHFARSTQVLGYVMPDAHGRSWAVPMIRGLDRPYGALPCDYEFGEDFLPAEVLRAQYRSLWNDSARAWDAYDESKGMPDSFAAQFVARCLAVNYRVGPAELNLLGELGLSVFDKRSVMTFAGCAVDAQAVLEFMAEKKTIPPLPVPAGTTSSRGTQDETTTGDQLAEK